MYHFQARIILPTDNGREIRDRCVARPTEHQRILIDKLGLRLPTRIRFVCSPESERSTGRACGILEDGTIRAWHTILTFEPLALEDHPVKFIHNEQVR